MASNVVALAGPSRAALIASSSSSRLMHPLSSSDFPSSSSRRFFSASTRSLDPADRKDKSHYQTLGISPSASRMEVKAAYFRLSKRYHPDVRKAAEGDESAEAKATERFHEVSSAYKVLSDDRQRRAYDRTLSSSPSSSILRHGSHTPGSSYSHAYTYEMHAHRRRGATHAWEGGPRGYTGRTHPQYTHPQYSHAHGSHATGTSSGRPYDPTSPFQSSTASSSTQSSSPSGTSASRRDDRLTGRQARVEEERAEHDRIIRESNLSRFLRAVGIVLVVSWVGGLGRSLGG
ncbi:DnaJ-domain-containing protein [Fomitiporia mediterranea MF3/22]|uniref:DnaJ-domain-containing protein n=1 Tax=Fomitiporia mediterranea (strain MF3/22) TaxID=694068 RepID=UPI00044078C2|nr:DnaJ-domain-containing protein [Fomitiporia mediterranea MF3/22]EJD01991.1 DnaJ-domain-containing protein [Fomitiporia mediterranea MF3/22]